MFIPTLVAGLVLGGAPAAATRIAVSPPVVAPGAAAVLTGTVPAAGPGSCTLTSAAALFPPDGDGPPVSHVFRVRFTVPASAPSGTYLVAVRCRDGDVGAPTSLRVDAGSGYVPIDGPSAGLEGVHRHRRTGPFWVGVGVLVMGIAVYLGVAEWRPWRHQRRRALRGGHWTEPRP